MAKTLRAGDTGVNIDVVVTAGGGKSDISAATTKEMVFMSPGGSKVTKTADFITNGKDGALRYVTAADDFTEVGLWLIQVHLVLPGKEYRSIVDSFAVQAAL